MYALFQLHSSDATKHADGYFDSKGDAGYSWFTQLGPQLAVAALDTRSARCRKTIVPAALLAELDKRVRT
jgi:hypothetical protein